MMQNFCGLRLNTFATIVGWLGSVSSLVMVVLLSVGLASLDSLTQAIIDNMASKPENPEAIRAVLLLGLSLYLTLNSVNLVSSALLVAGTVKERHLLLVPWLINAGIALVAGFLYFITMISLHISAPMGSLASLIIIGGIGLAFQYYVWYAIYSFYKQLQASREQQQLLGPAGTARPSYMKI